MSPAGLLVLAHALIGIAFIVGLVGRWIILGMAERATELRTMKILSAAASPFERIVIVASMLVLVFGVAAAWAQGRNLLGPLTGGRIDWLFVAVVLFLSNLPLVPVVFLPRGKAFAAALADAEAHDRITPALVAAWRDPVVRGAHAYELVTTTLVLVLMLTKPF